MDTTFELYLSDLTEEARERYLSFYEITEDEGNFDFYPIAVFEHYPEDYDE